MGCRHDTGRIVWEEMRLSGGNAVAAVRRQGHAGDLDETARDTGFRGAPVDQVPPCGHVPRDSSAQEAAVMPAGVLPSPWPFVNGRSTAQRR